MEKLKKSFKLSLLSVAIINFFAFLSYYVLEYLTSVDALLTVSNFIESLIGSFLPVFTAVLIFFSYTFASKKRAFVHAIALTLTRLIYFAPFYYVYYMNSGYDTADSLILLALHSFILLLLLYGESVILFLFMVFIAKKFDRENRVPNEKLLAENSPFDFGKPMTRAIFFASLIRFLVNLAEEIYDTTLFLIEYGDTLKVSEIVYMVISYLFIMATLLITQYASVMAKSEIYNKISSSMTE